MVNLSRKNICEVGKILINEEKSKSFIKQEATVSNPYVKMNILNAMVEDNIYINIIDTTIRQSHIKKLRNRIHFLQIRMILEGKLEKLNHKTNEKKIYKEDEIHIEYKKYETDESLLNKKDEHTKYICITLNEKYLTENGLLKYIIQDDFSRKIYEPKLKNKYIELFERTYNSELDKIYLKSKTMEIVNYVFEELKNKNETGIENLDDEDIKRVKQAKSILEQYFNENITIAILSKKVALNQTKLKKGFKELFNKTIHEYLKDIRLQKAVKYLQSNKYSVKEVASMVGYTNQGSFSYAFSNRYNCSPKEIFKKNPICEKRVPKYARLY